MTEAKRDVVLNPQRIGLVEYKQQNWVANAAEGTEIQDVLRPGYWAHTAAQFQSYDRIEVREESGLWILELLVLETALNWAKVYVLHKHEITGAAEEPPAASQHKVEWKGPQHKHAVIRLSDGAIIKDGFSDKAAAFIFLKQHEAVVSA